MDCCSDYTRHCRDNVKVETEPVYLSRSYFRCVTNILFSITPCFNISAVWMISRCPKEWSNDFVRENCHEPSTKLNNRTYDLFVPVFSPANRLTYRNQYCALCHNVVDYELWSLVFSSLSIQPDVKNLTRFLAQHGGSFQGVKPKDHRPLRYCFFPSVVKTCPGLNRSAHERCANGSVEIVTTCCDQGKKYYKNRACASCHGVKSPSPVDELVNHCIIYYGRITQAVDLSNHGVTLRTTYCARDQVFHSVFRRLSGELPRGTERFSRYLHGCDVVIANHTNSLNYEGFP